MDSKKKKPKNTDTSIWCDAHGGQKPDTLFSDMHSDISYSLNLGKSTFL